MNCLSSVLTVYHVHVSQGLSKNTQETHVVIEEDPVESDKVNIQENGRNGEPVGQ